MSVFRVPFTIQDLPRTRAERVDAWVDTGAFYSSVPRPLLESLGVTPHAREAFELADGRVVESDIGYAWIQVGEKSTITVVMFAEPESESILGAYTLEGMALAVDAGNQRLFSLSPLRR